MEVCQQKHFYQNALLIVSHFTSAGVETVGSLSSSYNPVIFIYDNKSADILQTFIFEMIHHPEVAKKAQDEMDRVIGKEQLPTLNDRPDLPYLDCIVREVFRYVFLL